MEPKFHYRIHRSPTLVSILSQINQIYATPSYLPKITFPLYILYFPSAKPYIHFH
jgi:hypothetical protein